MNDGRCISSQAKCSHLHVYAGLRNFRLCSPHICELMNSALNLRFTVGTLSVPLKKRWLTFKKARLTRCVWVSCLLALSGSEGKRWNGSLAYAASKSRLGDERCSTMADRYEGDSSAVSLAPCWVNHNPFSLKFVSCSPFVLIICTSVFYYLNFKSSQCDHKMHNYQSIITKVKDMNLHGLGSSYSNPPVCVIIMMAW